LSLTGAHIIIKNISRAGGHNSGGRELIFAIVPVVSEEKDALVNTFNRGVVLLVLRSASDIVV
jgi:hypothetical protein